MGRLTVKVIALILTLTLMMGFGTTAFARSPHSKGKEETGITINGIYYTPEEFRELLEYIEPIDDGAPVMTSRALPLLVIPAWAIGKWVIVGIGIIVVTSFSMTVAGRNIPRDSQMFRDVLSAIKKAKPSGNKENPTGNRVRDVEKRLKKEGFKKTGTGKGSHEIWKKGNRTVNVPNHGPGHEITIGTLRKIWREAGWIN